jgi:hypothetical protein
MPSLFRTVIKEIEFANGEVETLSFFSEDMFKQWLKNNPDARERF